MVEESYFSWQKKMLMYNLLVHIQGEVLLTDSSQKKQFLNWNDTCSVEIEHAFFFLMELMMA